MKAFVFVQENIFAACSASVRTLPGSFFQWNIFSSFFLWFPFFSIAQHYQEKKGSVELCRPWQHFNVAIYLLLLHSIWFFSNISSGLGCFFFPFKPFRSLCQPWRHFSCQLDSTCSYWFFSVFNWIFFCLVFQLLFARFTGRYREYPSLLFTGFFLFSFFS